MESAVQDLAAVIVGSYQGAQVSRGVRGTAGSGSGTRTLVEGLSFSVTHNHWLESNHLDFHASLPLQDPDGGTGQEDLEASDPRARGFEAPTIDSAKVGCLAKIHVTVESFVARHA